MKRRSAVNTLERLFNVINTSSLIQASRVLYKLDAIDLREAKMFSKGFYDSLEPSPNQADTQAKPKRHLDIYLKKSRANYDRTKAKMMSDRHRAMLKKFSK